VSVDLSETAKTFQGRFCVFLLVSYFNCETILLSAYVFFRPGLRPKGRYTLPVHIRVVWTGRPFMSPEIYLFNPFCLFMTCDIHAQYTSELDFILTLHLNMNVFYVVLLQIANK